MTTFTTHAAKTQLSTLIERAEAGEEVIIARRDKPVVRLVPVERPKSKRQFGSMKGRVSVGREFFEPLPEDELKLWEGRMRALLKGHAFLCWRDGDPVPVSTRGGPARVPPRSVGSDADRAGDSGELCVHL